MIELDQRIAEQLTEITLNSSLQVRCGSSNSFLVTASLIEPLINEFQMGGVYISASRPAPELISTLQEIDIPIEGIQFIDCVSSALLGGTENQFTNISYIDSPIMLENILLRTLFHLRQMPTEQNFVILDSVNALAIYNEEKMLAEYLHTFINTFRARDVLSAVVTVPDQTPPSVLSNLDLYCTDMIDRGQVVIS
jgi:archaellum biogenesis ATPase FlaH|tara:strand:- start:1185 stop:1769 length:585 start_codon:yes stop_codon:yes gene_type:complete